MRIKKYSVLFLIITLCLGMLTACGGDATYQVKVLDSQGSPYTSGVIVKFMQDGTQVAMQPVNESGVAEKILPKGNYTVELVFTDESIAGYCDPTAAVLSASKTAIELTLYNGVSGEGREIYATSPVTGESKEYKMFDVAVGSTYVNVEKEERNYFLFAPAEGGTYEIKIDNAELTLGYYGSPYYVQQESLEIVTDNTLSVSVFDSMIGRGETGSVSLVIGIDGTAEAADCILTIARIGDPKYSISEEPYTEYVTSHTPTPFSLTLGEGEELTYVDIMGSTADNQVVYNEEDGYYHFGSVDGPVVYIHLGKGAPHVALQTVIMGDGPAGGAPIRKYFFDENGEFIKKEDYTNILVEYFENMDEKLMIYPLTEDLVYIVQNGCDGWWDKDSPDYIFEGCNPEIGWMFALCYVK